MDKPQVKMNKPLKVLPNPCSDCPYATKTPTGIWHPDEYLKLTGYDDDSALETFLCHHSTDTDANMVCRGWLSVHANSVAVRVAILRGQITEEERDATVTEPLYATGKAAATAGLRGVRRPSPAAKRVIQRLAKRR